MKSRREMLSSVVPVPELIYFDRVPDEARFWTLAFQAWIVVRYAAEKGLTQPEIEKLKALFHGEYDLALTSIRRYLMQLVDRAERARWHDKFMAVSERTRALFFESLDSGIADWSRFSDLIREEREIQEAFHFDQGSWEFLVKDPHTGMLVPEGHESATLKEAKQTPERPGQGDGTTKKVGKGGRKPLSAKEAKKRQALIDSWTQARESGIDKYDFCQDKHIEIAYLDRCLDWNRHKRESHQ